MRLRVTSAVASATVLCAVLTGAGVVPADAQQQPRVPLPVELPPEGFSGEQFVDSAGCTFMRAGFRGETNWVARLNEDRTPMCGRQPTFPRAPERVAAATPAAPEDRPATAGGAASGGPSAEGAEPRQPTAPRPSATPRLARAPAPTASPAPSSALSAAPALVAAPAEAGRPVGSHPRCPSRAPYASFSTREDGTRVITCRALPGQAGTPAPAEPPLAAVSHRDPTPGAHDGPDAAEGPRPVGAHPSCPARAPYGSVQQRADGGRVVYCSALPASAGHRDGPEARRQALTPGRAGPADGRSGRIAAVAAPPLSDNPLPPGFAPAWADDRLNPMRARGTAEGEAQMRRVWTDEAPMRLVDQPRRGILGTVPPARTLTAAESAAIRRPYANAAPRPSEPHVSSAGSVRAPATSSGTGFVQVASFADPANAARTRAALESRGLPVVERQVRTSGGAVLRVVLAGPFAAQADARAAMATARGLGFRDAFLRR